jgi:hypothetical protein
MPKLPIDYSKGFIYKLCCLDVNIKDIYIGSSTNFKQRKQSHKNDCYNEKKKGYNSYKYKYIRDNGGWDNWTMIELHKFPCNDKRELEYEENRVMIELQSQLNSQKSYQTKEERIEYNKECYKKYREEHKEEMKDYHKNYREEHKEEIKIKKQIYDKNNKEEIKIKSIKYRLEHREMINMKKREKIACVNCGVMVSRSNITGHKKSKKCLDFNN